MWKVRVDCTYTKAAHKAARQSAVQSVLDSFVVTPVADQWAAGVVSQSNTRFTVSVDVADRATAEALERDLMAALGASPRSQTFVAVFDGG